MQNFSRLCLFLFIQTHKNTFFIHLYPIGTSDITMYAVETSDIQMTRSLIGYHLCETVQIVLSITPSPTHIDVIMKKVHSVCCVHNNTSVEVDKCFKENVARQIATVRQLKRKILYFTDVSRRPSS